MISYKNMRFRFGCFLFDLKSFATFLGYIARYAPSKTDKNPIKSIGFAELKVQKSTRHNL